MHRGMRPVLPTSPKLNLCVFYLGTRSSLLALLYMLYAVATYVGGTECITVGVAVSAQRLAGTAPEGTVCTRERGCWGWVCSTVGCFQFAVRTVSTCRRYIPLAVDRISRPPRAEVLPRIGSITPRAMVARAPTEFLVPFSQLPVLSLWSLLTQPSPQPTPPPKVGSFKSSISSIRGTTGLRPFKSVDTMSIDSGSTLSDSTRLIPEVPTRKGKASAIFTGISAVIKKTRSRSRLRPERLAFTTQIPAPPLPSPTVIPYNPPQPSSPPPPSTVSKRRKGKEKDVPPPVPSKDLEFPLDTNIDNMDGIIDYGLHDSMRNGDPSSPSSAFDSSAHSSGLCSDVSSSQHHQFVQGSSSSSPPSGSSTIFNNPNPFSTASLPRERRRHPSSHLFDSQKIGPKQRPPSSQSVPTLVGRDAKWTAPDSWAVDQAGEENEAPAEYSTSDGEDTLVSPSPSVRSTQPSGKKKRKRQTSSALSRALTNGSVASDRRPSFKFRIYRANNTYHVASIPLSATVGRLIPYLNNKLLFDPEREKHRLYLKERGRGGRVFTGSEQLAHAGVPMQNAS